MDKLKGVIHAGLINSTEKDYYEITLNDKNSGLEIVTVTISTENVAYLFGSHGRIPCDIELNRAKEIGLYHHVKTENVFIPVKSYDKEARIEAGKIAVKEFEVDGWEADIPGQICNSHYMTRTTDAGYYVNLTFRRYMDHPHTTADDKKPGEEVRRGNKVVGRVVPVDKFTNTRWNFINQEGTTSVEIRRRMESNGVFYYFIRKGRTRFETLDEVIDAILGDII